jgi:hypothetical protein
MHFNDFNLNTGTLHIMSGSFIKGEEEHFDEWVMHKRRGGPF